MGLPSEIDEFDSWGLRGTVVSRWCSAIKRLMRTAIVAGIDEALDTIRQTPESNPIWKNSAYRKFVVHHFPYLVFYEIVDDIVVVHAIAHSKRRPGYWADR